MCSVNFILNPQAATKDLTESTQAMVKASKHRGPDSTELLVQDSFAFGFNRLEIVGGNSGKQPIYDKKNGLILICNGEIFNYKELKTKFFPKDKFFTTSDVEIILHLYRKFGTNCLPYLEGQYGFLLYDTKKSIILLSRDRFGINPLFYYLKENIFIVASEIKSILASNLTKEITLDTEGIIHSLLFYGAIPPKTCFTNIYQIPPASYGIYDVKNKSISVKEYWTIPTPKQTTKNVKLAKEKVKMLLTKSVQKRLQGESIPGVYLSGGLDSSIIGSITNKMSKGNMYCFSITFEDKKYDESFYQEQLANELKIKQHKVLISKDEIINNLKECIFHVETPLIRTAPVPMLLLSEAVRKQNIKFVLCGEGADEIFAGYPVFLTGQASFENKWKIIIPYINLFENKEARRVAESAYDAIGEKALGKEKVDINRKKEILTKLSQYLLVNQGDRMSMANGVEQRFPFLDTELVEFAFSLDQELLFADNSGKKVLREAFRDMVPLSIIERKKQGYLAPDEKIIKELILADNYNFLLEENYFKKVNLFNFMEAKKLIEKVKSGSSLSEFDANALLFVLTTHLLYYIFLEKN